MIGTKERFRTWQRYPLFGALVYLLFGFLWISFSDSLLSWLVDDPILLSRYQTYKGFTYVILTALIAWALLKQRRRYAESLAESEWMLGMTFEHAAAGIAHIDSDGKLLRVNHALCHLLGYTYDELIQKDIQALMHPLDVMQENTIIKRLSTEHSAAYSLEQRYLHNTGKIVWTRQSIAIIPPKNNQPARYIVVIQDISAVKMAQQQQQESDLRFRTLLDSLPTISVQGYDDAGNTLYWNKGSELIYGYTKQEAVGQNLLELIIPKAMQQQVQDEIWVMATTHQAKTAGEITLQRKDGSPVTVYSSYAVITLPDKKPQIYCIDVDLTDRKKQEAQLAFLAEYDPLTRLPNRQHFNLQLDSALKLARRDNTQLALLLLDLDNFKTINDSYGHNAGDELLICVAEKLQECSLESTTLARFGGDEFAILLQPLTQPEDAARSALELLKALQHPFILSNALEVSSGASIGISLYPQHADNAEALLQGADAALYKAKAEGRNTYSYYTDNLTALARERLILEARLRYAVKHAQLCCYYQPQIDINSGSIIGAELLIRWHDPEHGFIPPAQFIPLAESCGLIHPIGHFVIEQACKQGKIWLDQGLTPIRLAVNVSAYQFSKGDLELQVITALAQHQFPAHLLELEVTESALMQDEDSVIRTMQQLRATGIRLAIDDFGTGYSSLAYLQRLPLDVLKVDRRFISNINVSDEDRQISKAIIALAHTLKFDVLAEGVETSEQLAVLRDMACDYYQGYYYSKPLPVEEFSQLLQAKLL